MMKLGGAILALFPLLAAILFVLCAHNGALADEQPAAPASGQYEIRNRPLERLKQSIRAVASNQPGVFDASDLDNFFKDQGTTSASKFLNQRGLSPKRAIRLAQAALKWRRSLCLSHLEASQFPCDLFKLGLVFEQGHAHQQNEKGEYVQTNPVIWIRLGALGAIIKQLERLTPGRLIAAASSRRHSAMGRFRQAVRHPRKYNRRSARADRKMAARNQCLLENFSSHSSKGLQQVLISIAWWLEDWARAHPNTKATLVLDFENSDFAFASWSVGEFFVRLDDMFPDLFESIIGFRYKAKLWSLHSPISMFNRIFKSRFSSSPETDQKLKFLKDEQEVSTMLPRIDSNGITMLPEHVSGTCVAPDEAKAPAGCQASIEQADGLRDAFFWKAVYNEFYHTCRAKARLE